MIMCRTRVGSRPAFCDHHDGGIARLGGDRKTELAAHLQHRLVLPQNLTDELPYAMLPAFLGWEDPWLFMFSLTIVLVSWMAGACLTVCRAASRRWCSAPRSHGSPSSSTWTI